MPAPAVLVLPQPDIANPKTASSAIATRPRSLRDRRPSRPTAARPAIASPAGNGTPGATGGSFAASFPEPLLKRFCDVQFVEFVLIVTVTCAAAPAVKVGLVSE